ncbi:ATP binding protein with TniB domain [Mycobacteroides abscessus subsp. bolletii]|nr:ATP binding protein with TniB domain [Mycobacteroides abscessus subsp. bolletii]
MFLSLSAGITLKGLNQKMLEFYGHPAASRASRTQLGSLAVDCVLSCATRLIVIDDLHFIDFTHRNGLEVSNHLKWLANEMPATFIFVGVGLKEKRFFNEGMLDEDAAYAQTGRRATPCPIVPFDIGSGPGFRAWVEVLKLLEDHIKLADSRSGMLTDHARTLHRRTQGYIGSLTNILDRLCHLAIATGAETIDENIIARAVMDNAAQNAFLTA